MSQPMASSYNPISAESAWYDWWEAQGSLHWRRMKMDHLRMPVKALSLFPHRHQSLLGLRTLNTAYCGHSGYPDSMVRLPSNDNQVSFSYWCILYLKESHAREGHIICIWIRSCRNLYPACSRKKFIQDFRNDTSWSWMRSFLRLSGSGSPSMCQCRTCYGAVRLSVSY